MDPQHAIHPQRVPKMKKERCADLTHLAHLEELANLGDFGEFVHLADVLNVTSPAEGAPT